ncbi:MAG: AAA family ATPase [Candidatus Aenigmarchaeota archaeon]|nr:AAA family ATPase [Candidatus Aenigmarchaeota archaeon]
MNSIFSVEESKIFKNEEVLFPEYLPELLPHREDKIKQLANNIFPVSRGRKAQNTFLFGSPGTGKTATTKFVFREFEEFSERVKTIYINCWDYKSAHAILSKIAYELEVFVQRRGMSKDEILEKLIEACKKTNKGLVVCLDEVDQLVFRGEEALYDLLRINQYMQNPVCLVFISNNPNVFVDVEPRIKSSLGIEEVEFKPYSLEEMKDILQERVKLAFHSVEDGVVLLAANHAVKSGSDVRVGLECLLRAGRLAEQENSNKVKVEHVKRILSSIKPVKPRILKERISEDERVVLEILEEKKELFSVELYREYCDRVGSPISERAFRDLINHLKETGLIRIKKLKGVKGRARIITPKL